jgi:hypothetical protein
VTLAKSYGLGIMRDIEWADAGSLNNHLAGQESSLTGYKARITNNLVYIFFLLLVYIYCYTRGVN